MTGHVVSFTPAGAPTRAVCSCGWKSNEHPSRRDVTAIGEAHAFAKRGTVEFAGLPPVERAS